MRIVRPGRPVPRDPHTTEHTVHTPPPRDVATAHDARDRVIRQFGRRSFAPPARWPG